MFPLKFTFCLVRIVTGHSVLFQCLISRLYSQELGLGRIHNGESLEIVSAGFCTLDAAPDFVSGLKTVLLMLCRNGNPAVLEGMTICIQ